jgi:hypothetical protein
VCNACSSAQGEMNYVQLQLNEAMVGQGLLTVEASQSHSDMPLSVGLLWMSDQPDAETFSS